MVPILFEPRAPTLKSKIQTRSKRSYFELSTFKVGFLRPVYAREFNKRGYVFWLWKENYKKNHKKEFKNGNWVVCSWCSGAFVRDGTANEMGSLCVYLWGDYLEKTKNKQINKTFSKQSTSRLSNPGVSRTVRGTDWSRVDGGCNWNQDIWPRDISITWSQAEIKWPTVLRGTETEIFGQNCAFSNSNLFEKWAISDRKGQNWHVCEN